MWGTWAYNTHISFQHIDELRELINVGLPHEAAKRKFARVVCCSLHGVGIFVHVHGTEFQALECLAKKTGPGLAEENRSGALQLDEQCDDGK